MKVPKAGYASKVGKGKSAKFVFRKQASSYAINGIADLYCVINSISIWIEVKSEKGIQSDAQIEFEHHCKTNGVPYYLVKCLEDVMIIVDRHKAKSSLPLI